MKIKKQFTFLTLAVICMLLTVACFGQTKNRFYATIEDYKNDKPMAGYEIEENSWDKVFGESFKVKTSSGAERTKLSNLPSKFFTYMGTNLMCAYKTNVFNIMAYGGLCVYERYAPDQGGWSTYYSEGINGEWNKFKPSVFDEYLAKYGLQEGYEKDKQVERLPGERPFDLHQREKAVKIKYYKLINEKMK